MMHWSSLGIDGHDSAEIHGVHVLSGASEDLLDYDSTSFLWWMEWIPKRVKVSVRTQVWGRCAESNPIVWPLPTTSYLRCNKSCQPNYILDLALNLWDQNSQKENDWASRPHPHKHVYLVVSNLKFYNYTKSHSLIFLNT